MLGIYIIRRKLMVEFDQKYSKNNLSHKIRSIFSVEGHIFSFMMKEKI